MASRATDTDAMLYQVLPTLLRLNADKCLFLAATIYFILLSTVFHIVAIWQFRCRANSSTSTNEMDFPNESLVSSTEIHLQALEFLSRNTTRCDHIIVLTIHHVLRLIYQWNDIDAPITKLKEAMDTLAHYRWCKRGTGIVALSKEAACQLKNESAWLVFENTWTLPYPESEHESERRRTAINSLCDSRARACRPGFFDLSIRIF